MKTTIEAKYLIPTAEPFIFSGDLCQLRYSATVYLTVPTIDYWGAYGAKYFPLKEKSIFLILRIIKEPNNKFGCIKILYKNKIGFIPFACHNFYDDFRFLKRVSQCKH